MKKKRTITAKYGETDEGKPVYRTEEAVPRRKIRGLQRQLKRR